MRKTFDSVSANVSLDDDAIDRATKAEEEKEIEQSYSCHIKSHNPYPDFEESVMARNPDEAIEKFYHMLRGEWDKESLEKHVCLDEDL